MGRNCGVGFNAWATGAAYIFELGRNKLDGDYLADFRALGLLEVQPGNAIPSMFRMRCANRACEREKLGKLRSGRVVTASRTRPATQSAALGITTDHTML
jgi:hypothetical protein